MRAYKAFVVVLLLTSLVRAQQTLEQKADDLKRRLQTPVVNWTDDFIVKMYQEYIDLYLQNLLWDPDFHQKVSGYLLTNPPKITVEVTGELRTPYESHGEIILPVEYLNYLSNISMLVGHDVYEGDHYVHFPRPLLSTPFRTSRILPLLNSLDHYTDVAGFPEIQSYIRCMPSDPNCSFIQTASFNALVVFFLVHEMTHQLLHHQILAEGSNLEQELAADRGAYIVLTKFAEDLTPQKATSERDIEVWQATKFAPIAWLYVESSRQNAASAIAGARKNALLQTLDKDDRDDVDSLLKAETNHSNLARMTITWDQQPDLLLIDGVKFQPDAVGGQTLLTTAMRHHVLAVRKGSLAVAETSPYSEDAKLFYSPFEPADLASIVEAEGKSDWAAVLLKTSDDDLQPRDAALGVYHWEALHKMGFDSLIIIQDWSSIPDSKRRTYQGWQLEGQPLGTWYAGSQPPQ